MIDTLIKLRENGELKQLVSGGYLSTKTLAHIEIYLEFDRRKRLGHRTTDIVFDIGEIFKKSPATVYAILKKFRCE